MNDKGLQNEKFFHDKRFIGDDHIRFSTKKYYSVNKISKDFFNKIISIYSKDKRLLELGCGKGENIERYDKYGASVTGIDISSEGVKKASKLINDKKINAECFVMNVEKTEFNDNSFNIVVGSGIIHHININKAYIEISRILNKNGHAVFFEPLGHNPVINLYRKLTPKMRTIDEHPLMRKDLILLNKYFKEVEIKYFTLFTFLSVPFRKLPIFNVLYKILFSIDKIVLKLPLIKNWAWVVVIHTSKPYK